TQNGVLARMDAGNWTIVSAGTNWPGGRAVAVSAAPDGTIRIGSDRGLIRWQKERFRTWRRRNGLAADSIRSLLVSSNGDVTLIWPGRIQRFHNDKFQTFGLPQSVRAVRGIAEDAAGNLWLGTSDAQLL